MRQRASEIAAQAAHQKHLAYLTAAVPDVKLVDWPRCEYFRGAGVKYDATEVSLCIEYDANDGEDGTFVETADPLRTGQTEVERAREIFADPEPGSTPLRSYWTVYGHLPEGGVEALADGTYEVCTRIAAALEAMILARIPIANLSPEIQAERRKLLDRLTAIALDDH